MTSVLPEIRPIFRLATIALSVLAIVPSLAIQLRAQSISDTAIADELLAQMSQKGLTGAAARYCEARVSLATDLGTKTLWTQRLMEALDQAALRGTSISNEPWLAADTAYDEFVAANPTAPRLAWLRWQILRGNLLETQSQLATYLAAPGRTALKDALLQNVRRLLKECDELAEEIETLRPIAARRSVSDTENPSAEELGRLLVDTTLIQIEALVIRSRCYPEQSRDQISAASQVVSLVDDVFQKTERSWGSRNKLILARSYGWLKTGRIQEAVGQLGGIAKSSSDNGVRARAAAVLAEHFVGLGEIDKAKIALQWIPAEQPQAALVQLQLMLASVSDVESSEQQEQIERLLSKIKEIESQFGSYWRNRAEAIVASRLSGVEIQGSTDVPFDLVIAEARQLLAANDTSAAITKLLEGSEKEVSAGRVGFALRLAGQASALLQNENQWAAAIDAVVDISTKNSTNELAASTFFNALLSQAQALRSNMSSADQRDRYVQLLTEQVLTWPNSKEADQAQQWLSGWLAANRKQELLCEILGKRVLRADERLLSKLVPAWYVQIGGIFPIEQRRKFYNSFIEQVSQSQSGVSLSNSLNELNVLLNWQSVSKETARKVLFSGASVEKELQDNVESTSASRSLSFLADFILAARAEDQDRAKLIAQSVAGVDLSPEVLFVASENLMEVIDASADRSFWARQLPFTDEWANRLKDSSRTIDPILALRFQLLRSKDETQKFALLKTLPELQTANSKNANVLELAAEMLSDAGRIEESTRLAKRLLVGSKRGSVLSLKAKWRLIKNLRASGDQTQAQKLLATTLATASFPNEYWKSRFTSLGDE